METTTITLNNIRNLTPYTPANLLPDLCSDQVSTVDAKAKLSTSDVGGTSFEIVEKVG